MEIHAAAKLAHPAIPAFLFSLTVFIHHFSVTVFISLFSLTLFTALTVSDVAASATRRAEERRRVRLRTAWSSVLGSSYRIH